VVVCVGVGLGFWVVMWSGLVIWRAVVNDSATHVFFFLVFSLKGVLAPKRRFFVV